MLTAGLAYRTEIENWMIYGVVAALGTFAVYNLQRLAKQRYNYANPWMTWVSKQSRIILILSVLAAVSAGIVLVGFEGIDLQWWVFNALVLAGSVFYVLRLGKTNLREIPGLKIVLIAFTWTYVVYLFPHINSGNQPSALLSTGIFLYIIAVTIPFDIRDLELDSPRQLTIPQLFGVRGAKFISVLFLNFSFLAFAIDLGEINTILIFVGGIQLLPLLLVNRFSGDRFVAGVIDGMISLTGIMYFFF